MRTSLFVSATLVVGSLAVSLLSPNAYADDGLSLRVGIYQNEPKIFRDKQGNPQGLFVDLLDAVAADQGWSLTYVDCRWPTCLKMLRAGQIDVMPDMAISARRAKHFDFSNEAVTDSFSRIYAPDSADIDTLDDLRGRRIAVLDGSSQQAELQRRNQRLGDALRLVAADSFDQAFRMVEQGHADAVIANNFFGDRRASTFDLKRTPVVLQPARLYFAAHRGTPPEVLQSIDEHLSAWQKQSPSPYYDALRRWTAPPDKPRTPGWLKYVLMAAVGVLVLAGLIIVVLRREVAKRTRHLHQKNEELRQNQRHLSLMVDHGPDIVAHVDTSGQLVFVNRRIEDIAGWSPEDVVNTPFAELFEEVDDADGAACLRGEVQQSPVFRAKLRHQNGHAVPVEVRAGTIRNEQGDVWLCQMTLRDLSRQMRALRALERTQRMETVGTLAGGIAHDFNNLLAVISSCAQLALSQVDDDSAITQDLQDILEATHAASRVTGQLLSFSKRRAGQRQPTSVSETIRKLSEVLERFVDERIDLQIELSDGTDEVLADPSQLEQIVLNLTVNARDAIADQGHIRITTRVDDVDDEVVLEVSDTGCGMDQETLEHAFEPFFTTKEDHGGTGLGMATIYGAVLQADGHIDITSAPGEGTCVTIRLPRRAADAHTPAVAPTDP